jgi:hypothetical protein
MRGIYHALPLLIGLVLTLTGCASISVEQRSVSNTDRKPKKIYVADFSTAKGEFNVDREGKELAEFKKNLRSMMLAGITYDLTKRLVPAVTAAKKPLDDHEDAWLLCGQFVKVNQGSRALRGIVGFGAGGTKMICEVQVYELAGDVTKPFLTFTTTGGSNAEPGAVTAIATTPLMIAIQAAASSAGGLAHGISEDTARTTREITAELSDYMYKRHWITEDQWIKPKSYTPDTALPPSAQ